MIGDSGERNGPPGPKLEPATPTGGPIEAISCRVHDPEPATARCLVCAELLCSQCAVAIRGRIYCAAHAAEVQQGAGRRSVALAWCEADLADFWTRAVGYGVDAVLLGLMGILVAFYVLLLIPLWALARFHIISAVAFSVLLGIYNTVLVGRFGQTLGHSLLGLTVLRTDGSSVSYWRAFLRWIGYILCTMTGFLGFLFAAWSRKRQGLHDKLADTVVLGAALPFGTKVWISVALLAAICLGTFFVTWFFGMPAR